MVKDSSWFLYNYRQANFFIEHGIASTGCGKGNKGDIYVKFERNEKSEAVQDLWLKEKYGDSPRPSNK